jgi:hypothetical protein
MPLDNTERLYLDRQIAVARAILVSLSLVALLETSSPPVRLGATVLLAAYLVVALFSVLGEMILAIEPQEIPLWVDIAALAGLFLLATAILPVWLLLLFLVFALAARGYGARRWWSAR